MRRMTPSTLLSRGIKWFLVSAVLLLALNELALDPVLPIPTVGFLALFIAAAQAWTDLRRANNQEPIPPAIMLAFGIAGLAFWIPVWWNRRDSHIPLDERTFAGLIAVPTLLLVAGLWAMLRRRHARQTVGESSSESSGNG
jgi:hypothetical protein